MRRELQMAIISDVHLGTYGCHAVELLQYLENIRPETLIINGDFIEIQNFQTNKFPNDHLKVFREIMKMAEKGTKVYYITGNHDDLFRHYADFNSGNFYLRNKMVFIVNEKSHWVFHGDVFDTSIKFSPFIARLGGKGYGFLIGLNRFINKVRQTFGKPQVSIAQNIKTGFKDALRFMEEFEESAVKLAETKNYDYVICGHIHRPKIEPHITSNGNTITYMNAGDWVENLTALELQFNKWSIYRYNKMDYVQENPKLKVKNEKKKEKKQDSKEKFLQEILEDVKV